MKINQCCVILIYFQNQYLERLLVLILKLTSLGKNEDIAKCAADADYREKLYQLYDIKEENQD